MSSVFQESRVIQQHGAYERLRTQDAVFQDQEYEIMWRRGQVLQCTRLLALQLTELLKAIPPAVENSTGGAFRFRLPSIPLSYAASL